MSIQVRLRLNLQKNEKKITVKYDTFIKATYDQYLIASLALHSTNYDEAMEYIDNITGAGSLNSHFKKLFATIIKFSNVQLSKIMENSMFPISMINDKNRYDYYPELNISLYKNRIYEGDLGEYENLLELLYIQEDIIDLSISTVKEKNQPEQYVVDIDNSKIMLKMAANQTVAIDEQLFKSVLVKEIDSAESYEGVIHPNCEGGGWNILNNSTLNNLISDNNYYYNGDGDHVQIRNDGVKVTTVAELIGLFVCKERVVGYSNIKYCKEVILHLEKHNKFDILKNNVIVDMLKIVNSEIAKRVVDLLLKRGDNKIIAEYGLKILTSGITTGWSKEAAESFLKYSNSTNLNYIYKANSAINYTVGQILQIDKTILNSSHLQERIQYENDISVKKDEIRQIIGLITTSGLRERVKKMKSNDDTKKFSRLCNELIGHEAKDLNNITSMDKVDQWYNKAINLKELSVKVDKMLSNQERV